jgi:myosin protein heavy chain
LTLKLNSFSVCCCFQANKKLQQSLAEQACQLESQEREKAELREAAAAADRRAHSFASELEEARAHLEQAERLR